MAHPAILADDSAQVVDSGSEKLLGRRNGQVGWLIFNNPDRRNAVSLEMWQAIPRVLSAFEADPAVRAVVIAGAGGRSFVAGADISQFEAERNSPEANERYKAVSGLGHAALATLSKPLIAMIDGFCIGGGMSMAMACDLRFASESARFGIPAARLGLGYNYASVARLVSLVGPMHASDLLFTARQVSASEALQMGLVNRVVPSAELEALVTEHAGMIAENAPLTIRASKLAIGQAISDPDSRDRAALEAALHACFASADYAEGRRAFMEKRRPRFTGQ